MGFLLRTSIAGDGIALLPAYVCQPSIAAGRLVGLLPGLNIPSYDMVLISPRLKNQSKAQTAFRSYVDASDFSQLSAGL
jgi:DNA-binding transcriptional LysR family regulator